MKKLIAAIFSIVLVASVAVAQQYCPYTGRPLNQPPVGQTMQVSQPPNFDNQRLMQQQKQRASLQASQQLQRDNLAIQHRIQTAQMEYGFKSPPTQFDAQTYQQQVQQLQQEMQSIQSRFQDEMRRVNTMQ